MDPLIIVATPNNCWLHPDTKYPKTVDELVEESIRCREAGAAVLHTHGLADIGEDCCTKGVGKWTEVVTQCREKSGLLIQSGMSTLTFEQRIDAFKAKSDMVSIILNHHDEDFVQCNTDVLHPMEELEDYAVKCREYRVKPEFEIWHAGSIWNLNSLIEKDLLDGPYINTLFFGWPGGTWSPPTVQEYLYRRSLMPEGAKCVVSIMEKPQMDILVAAIRNGDGVRVGTEDYPFNQQGKLCEAYELVKEIADISRSLGREVATPEQAREILGIYD